MAVAGVPPQYTGYPTQDVTASVTIDLTISTGVEGGKGTGDF